MRSSGAKASQVTDELFELLGLDAERAVLVAVASTLYWPSYHAYFASLGDSELKFPARDA